MILSNDTFNRLRNPSVEAELRASRDWIGNNDWLDLWYWYMELRKPSDHEICDEVGGDVEQVRGAYRGARVWLDCYHQCGLVVPILVYVYEQKWLAYALSPEPTAETAQVAVRDAWDRHLMPYADYLQTDWWKLKRLEVLGYSPNLHVCRLCHSRNCLNVHHNTYARRGFEEEEDLIVLCRSCHKKFHAL